MREKTIEAKLVQAVRRGCGDKVPVTAKIRKGFREEMEYRTVWYSCPAAESPSLS